MTLELFTEHHPRTLSDYMAKGFVGWIERMMLVLCRNDIGGRAIMVTSVLSSLSMSLAYARHLRSVELLRSDREETEDLLGQAASEHFHLFVLSKIFQQRRWVRMVTYVLHGISSLVFRTFAVRTPHVAHRILGYAFERAIHHYSVWIEDVVYGKEESKEVPSFASLYFELGEEATFVDLLTAMRMDNMRHRDIAHIHAEQKKHA
jgi:ubiquinol oxidase